MSNSGSSYAYGNPIQINLVWCPHAGGSRLTGSPAGCYNHPLSRSSQTFCSIRFLSLVSGRLGTVHPLLTLNFFSTWCHVIGPTLLKSTFYAHHFYFHSFTASDGSEGTTAGRVVSPHSIMVHPALSWYTQLYHGTPSSIMVHPALSWYTQLHHGAPSSIMVHPAPSWYTQLHHGTPSSIMVHPALSWHTQFYHGTPSSIMALPALSWYTQLYHGTPSSIMVHPALSWYTHLYHGTPSSIMVHPALSWYTQLHHGTPSSIMVHHGFRNEEVKHVIHHTPHCWLTDKVIYPADWTMTFLWSVFLDLFWYLYWFLWPAFFHDILFCAYITFYTRFCGIYINFLWLVF